MRALGASRTSVVPGGALAPLGARNPLWRNARAVPSLDLRFADNKSLVDATTGASLVTFTRASSATYTDSAGVLRSAVTNLLLRSEEFGTSPWSVNGSATITADQSQSPTGTTTADLLTSPFGGPNRVNQSATIQASSNYTFSVYVKAVNTNGINLRLLNSGGTIVDTYADFLFSSGAFANITGAGSFASLNAGNGWYRISCTFGNGNNTDCNMRIGGFIGTAQTGTTSLLWGAQLEQSSTVGEYIPTTSTINSAPRFDHNPTTGESLGLLVEEARTNIATQSEALDASPWGVSSLTVTANSTDTLSPDGVTYPEKFLETTATSNHTFYRSVGLSITAGTVYTASVFIKRIGGQYYQIIFDDNITVNGGYVNVDLVNGTITASANYGTGASIASSITRFGNGWFRISITSTAGALATIARVAVNTLTSGSQTQFAGFTGNTSNGCYLWGAVAEAGAFPTSYIPTTTATVTRAADVASITGSNFSSWYNQTEGTVFAEYRLPAAGIGIVNIDDGTSNNVIPVFVASAVLQAASANALVAGVNSGRLDSGGSFVANSLVRCAYAIKVADRALSANGATATTSATPSAMPVVTQLQIQGATAFTSGKGGTIKRLTYWPVRLANTTLQQITQP